VAFQAVPLPVDLLATLAPTNAALWTDLLSVPPLPQSGEAAVLHAPVTLYPQETLEDLRLVFSFGLLFVAVVNLYRRPGPMRRLLLTISLVGLLVAVVKIAQSVTGAAKFLGIWEQEGVNPTVGLFVHYGHLSQCLNLCIGAGLALLLLRLAERDHRGRYRVEDLMSDLRAPERRLDLLLMAMIVCGIVAIAISRSRNGLISMAVAGFVCATVLHWTKYLRGTGWSLGGLAVVAFLALLFIGFDPVYDRMATLENVQDSWGDRGLILDGALAMVPDFRWLGIGQAAFDQVYPAYDLRMSSGRVEHAENQYVELLVETGLWGLLLSCLFVLPLVFRWVQRMRKPQHTMDAVIFGIVFGCVAVAFHATSDFGLRVPAVAGLMTVMLGLVASRATARELGGRVAHVVFGLGFVAAAAALFAQLPAVERARQADQHFRSAEALEKRVPELMRLGWRLAALDQAKTHLEQAVALVPGRVEYQLRLALVGWQRVVTAEEIDFVQLDAPLSLEQKVRLRTAAQEAFDMLSAARAVCPVHGLLWTMMGQFAVEWLERPEGAAWIQRGWRYAPENDNSCLASARQLLKQDKVDESVAMFRRAVRMGASGDRVMAGVAVELGRPDVAARVAEGNWGLQLALSGRLRDRPEHLELATRLRAAVKEQLQAIVAAEGAAPSELSTYAQMCMRDAQELEAAGNAEEAAAQKALAIENFRRLMGIRPESGERLQLAQLLLDSGDKDGARNELRRLLNHNPGNRAARDLLQSLPLR
jgi:O-antigen ligase/tetratricopeptide (TPR) repeat protein